MMNMVSTFLGFKNRLLHYLQLTKELELIRAEDKKKNLALMEALRVFQWMEEKSFKIDPKMRTYVLDLKKSRDEILLKMDSIQRLMESSFDSEHYGNFRHVVFSLAKEKNISLESLADQLDCPSSTFTVLCRDGQVDKVSYLKLLKYFDLEPYSSFKPFSRYCPEYQAELDAKKRTVPYEKSR